MKIKNIKLPILTLLIVSTVLQSCNKQKSINNIIISDYKTLVIEYNLLEKNYQDNLKQLDASDLINLKRLNSNKGLIETNQLLSKINLINKKFSSNKKRIRKGMKTLLGQLTENVTTNDKKLWKFINTESDKLIIIDKYKKYDDETLEYQNAIINVLNNCKFKINNNNIVFQDKECDALFNDLKLALSKHIKLIKEIKISQKESDDYENQLQILQNN